MPSQTISSPSISRQVESPVPLRPLGVGFSLIFFGIPAVIAFIAFHVLLPWIHSLNYDELTSYLAALGVPMVILFLAVLIAYKLEGHPITRQAFAKRMRLPRLHWRDLFWGLGIFAVGGTAIGLLSGLVLSLIQKGWIPLPNNLPAIADPRVSFSPEMLVRSAGGVIHGRWDIAILYLVVFFFNIVGEELWWRGYILPRQEIALGRWAWLIHGTLWTCFHAFKWWDILPLLPLCLITAYCAQHTRSTWGGLIGHALSNGLGMTAILWSIVS